MIETGVVIVDGSPVHWHLPPGRSSGSLPDSRNLWDVMWGFRDRIDGFAHSHPGSGFPSPSSTDLSTFEAVENGLGRRLSWWITSSDCLVLLRWNDLNPGYDLDHMLDVEEPDWVRPLRALSKSPSMRPPGV